MRYVLLQPGARLQHELSQQADLLCSALGSMEAAVAVLSRPSLPAHLATLKGGTQRGLRLTRLSHKQQAARGLIQAMGMPRAPHRPQLLCRLQAVGQQGVHAYQLLWGT